MTTVLDARLERLLGGAELSALRQRLRRYFEQRGADHQSGTLHLTKLSASEHEALSLLTGRPPSTARSMRVDVMHLDNLLRDAGLASSLRAALELIDGPIENRAALHATRRARWNQLASADCLHAALHAWLQIPVAVGLLKRMARNDFSIAELLLARTDAVLRRLPAAGITRAQLAAETLGNAHALDAGQAAATLVLAAWRHGERIAASLDAPLYDSNEAPQAHLKEERVRDVWARAGVLVNELARPALFLNLPARSLAWPAGEPSYLSLRSLLRTPPAWSVSELTLFVCENPNLVAIAADRLGARCAPLVCTEGMPAAAQRTLLTQLARAGAQLFYHGDFDWPGIRIANYVMRTWQVRPWRFRAEDYETAVMDAPHTERDLLDAPATATWDPALTAAMQRSGLGIAEESVVESLLEDLRQ